MSSGRTSRATTPASAPSGSRAPARSAAAAPPHRDHRNLREHISEARANGWLGKVEELQVALNAAMAKLTSLNRTSTDGRPELVDLGMPVFTGTPP
ncbi:hypothetical protein ACFXPY_44815 [Streptomyces sp. NPDC059153]|uniref:hypothetical protein n=1 Tax=unclassified Streptomyces TaxID=2593676 RepID=UPI003688F48B